MFYFDHLQINRECVRGLWAGQQQELIFFRNSNPERGSIQNAKQALRNIVNSSCDQPIGYPIYVSPLLTSYCETSEPLTSITGRSTSFPILWKAINRLWNRMSGYCSSDRNNSRSGSSINNVTTGFQETRTAGSGERASTGSMSNSMIDRRSIHRPDSTSQHSSFNANTEDSKTNKSITRHSSEVVDRIARSQDKGRNVNEGTAQSNIGMVELNHHNSNLKLKKSNPKSLESSFNLESRTLAQGSSTMDTGNNSIHNSSSNRISKHADIDSMPFNRNEDDTHIDTDDHSRNIHVSNTGKYVTKSDTSRSFIAGNSTFPEQSKASSASSV